MSEEKLNELAEQVVRLRQMGCFERDGSGRADIAARSRAALWKRKTEDFFNNEESMLKATIFFNILTIIFSLISLFGSLAR